MVALLHLLVEQVIDPEISLNPAYVAAFMKFGLASFLVAY